jgi:hypothetical protein
LFGGGDVRTLPINTSDIEVVARDAFVISISAVVNRACAVNLGEEKCQD